MSSEPPPSTDHTVQTIECPRLAVRGPWRVDVGTENEPASVVLRAGDELTLGSGRAAALRIEDAAVSHLHCRLRVLDSGIAVEDLASKNGLYVGGARVAAAVLAESGAAFVVGRSAVSVRVIESDEDEKPSDPLPGVIGCKSPGRSINRKTARSLRVSRAWMSA